MNEEVLFRLTGLSIGQYKDLHAAGTGYLGKLNPARAKAMAGLIDPDLRATKAGYQLLGIIEALGSEDWYWGPRDCVEPDQDYQVLTKFIRDYSDGRLRSVHIKAIVAIYNNGALSERFLAHIYGQRTTNELLSFGIIEANQKPEADGWRIYRLTSQGNILIQDIENWNRL